ncbi:iron chelate uptake ABC transporter family permease subunit [Acuticoccus sp. I52.16.1]|uniref:iron chelate uptake ABC transporter family permease subunit n=1 Tax=Acuticoccus sp. I52.16.1 TaxID=2928472 RepID=UPI001FD26E06|nr:iron chelate uptake ABC transporter family permease subunit [Acuticoccus sp. I52.16.1]UOM35637.1 iron chelate uptake ABC transporter family permease subunit [Acuticoccus sp. I52.16.1]
MAHSLAPHADQEPRTARRERIALAALGLAAVVAIALSLTVGLKGNLAFALELRTMRLAALLQVGVAIAVSTVIFQTVTGNRILTPSLMGMDALYLLIQSVLVFTLGAVGFAALPSGLLFLGQATALALLAAVLFVPILARRSDMVLLLLAGVVLGILFRSLTDLVARLIDPNAFAVVQSATFADFNTIDETLIVPCVVVTVIGATLAWRSRHLLDVMALGEADAVGLGVAWRRAALGLVLLVGILVAVSTALVGPVALLGLLVVALAERIVGTTRHAVLLPAAALTAVVLLVGGQTILAHVFGNTLTLGIVIEFAGGLLFLLLLLSSRLR